MLLLLLACAPTVPSGPTARERFVAAPPPADGPLRLGGAPWGRPIGSTRHKAEAWAEVVALEGGRWATRTDEGGGRPHGWALWDPARGLVSVASGAVVTPDGAWVTGACPDGDSYEDRTAPCSVRLDPDVQPRAARVVRRPGGPSLVWGPEVAALLPPSHGGPGTSPDGELHAVSADTDPDRAVPVPGLRLVQTGGDLVRALPGCVAKEQVWWASGGERLACRVDGGVAVFDRRGRSVATFDGAEWGLDPQRVAWSADGRFAALVQEGRVAGWHLDQDRLWIVDLASPGMAVAPTDDGTLVIASDGSGLAILDAADGARLTPTDPVAVPRAVTLGPRGEVAAAFDDATVRTWDAAGRPLGEGRLSRGHADALVWFDGGLCAATARGVACFDADGRAAAPFAEPELPRAGRGDRGGAVSLDLAQTGSSLAFRMGSRDLRLDLRDGALIEEDRPSGGRTGAASIAVRDGRQAEILPDGAVLVTPVEVPIEVAPPEGLAEVHDQRWVMPPAELDVEHVRWDGEAVVASGRRAQLRLLPDGSSVVAPIDRTLRNAARRTPPQSSAPKLPEGPVRATDASGAEVAVADAEQVWFRRADGELVRLAVPGTVALAAGPTRIAVAARGIGVFVVDRASGDVLRMIAGPQVLQGSSRGGGSLAWSPDERRLAFAMRRLWVWGEDGAEIRTPRDGSVAAFAVSADGARIAVRWESSIALLDARTGGTTWVDAVVPDLEHLGFVGDRLVTIGRGPLAIDIAPDGTVSGARGLPFNRDLGLVVDDGGQVELHHDGARWEVAASGAVRRLGPAPGAAGWRLRFAAVRDDEARSTVTVAYAHPGRTHAVPDTRPLCTEGAAYACSTVPASRGAPVSLEGLDTVLPSPSGEWVVGRARARGWVMRGPAGEETRLGNDRWTERDLDGTTIAWAGPRQAVVAARGRVGLWEVGSRAELSRAIGAPRALAAGGELQARLTEGALLIGPIGADAVSCALPGGYGPIALSPSGRWAAWLDRDHGLWRADVERCEVVQRPPRMPLYATGSWSRAHATSPDGRYTVVRERGGPPRVWSSEEDAAIGELPLEVRDVRVSSDGLVAWTAADGTVGWWRRDLGAHALPHASEVLGMHPEGGLVLVEGDAVVLLTRRALEAQARP